jgi:hypothetical protein
MPSIPDQKSPDKSLTPSQFIALPLAFDKLASDCIQRLRDNPLFGFPEPTNEQQWLRHFVVWDMDERMLRSARTTWVIYKHARDFAAYCRAQTFPYPSKSLHREARIDFLDRVDRCQNRAVALGLVDLIGQDAVQAIMAAAFVEIAP